MLLRKIDLMIEFAKKLWPLNRSLTGKGVNSTLHLIKKKIPIKILNFKSEKKFLTGKSLKFGI